MASISTADFKNGMGLRIKDKVCTLVEFQHVKPGKGGAFVRYKTKDIKTGRVVEQTCNAGSKFESVQLFTKEMQYLYNDGVDYIFMDNETYEQVSVPSDFVGDNAKWLRENDTCQLLYAEEEPADVYHRRGHRDRSRREGRYRPGRLQARDHRYRCRRPGPHVSQRGREHQGRHPYGRIRFPRLAFHLVI